MVLGIILVVAGGVWIGQNHSAPTALASTALASSPASAAGPPTAPAAAPDPGASNPTPGPVSSTSAGDGPPPPSPTVTAAVGVELTTTPSAAAPDLPAITPDPRMDGAHGTPVQLDIAVLGVSAAIDPVLTDGQGVLRPPDDPGRVGWWVASAPPGAVGPTVLVGHVDSATAGAGALLRITDLELGDRIGVGVTAQGTVTYAVTSRQILAKADGLPADLFALDGPARLVLITCGGPFDASTGSYQDNVVVIADPVP